MFPLYQEKYQEMIDLFHQYLKLISKDHHKTRDGHLEIQYHHYGWGFDKNNGEWRISHDGYVSELFLVGDNDLEELMDKAIHEIKNMIKDVSEN